MSPWFFGQKRLQRELAAGVPLLLRFPEKVNERFAVVGASMDPIEVAPNQLLFGKKGIKGWAGGIPTDLEDTLRFAEMTGVRPMIEKFPLIKAAEGYARMMSGKAEFRVVLTM